ncbi:hypothetical protein Ahy_A03g015754 [Arachis hypogaea]|uniref:Aminotransferase-like plant mobile domain-containing protein n=1 Tax=Arachis hypogaea TaxID=3818 RepID=A0A445E184_ARAHY|nr:hypothetical protein Ahy_A03g015754 [Arachis hypogaea]
MPFGECTITLQDVAYQLGLAVDGRYVSGCLTDFHMYIEGGRPAWVWFEELLGVIPPPSQVQKFAVNCTWFQETFGECPEGADEETALSYLPTSPATAFTSDGFPTLLGLRRWVPTVGVCSIGMVVPVHVPSGKQTCGEVSGPTTATSVLDLLALSQVVHPEALEPRHMAVWRSVMSLIYFAVVEWHQVDRVLPQFGGVQPLPRPTLNIDFLMSKDGRGGDRWFPSALQHWHILWETRADYVLRFDVVANPGPSHAYLDW